MTARMADPSPRAQKRRDTSPTPVERKNKKRGLNAGGDIATARASLKNSGTAASAAEIDVNKPLTEKQRNFAKFWAQGDTIPNATLRAGFAQDGLGYRLARQPNVLALRNKYAAKYESAADMSRKKVMDGLLEAVEMAKLMSEPATMVAGWREIGKMCGYYAPVETRVKVDVTGNVVMTRLNGMSDEELLALISAGSTPALSAPVDQVEDTEDQP